MIFQAPSSYMGDMRSPIRKEVLKIKGYHLSQPAHRIKLNQNESPYDLPAPLKSKILEKLGQADWNRYPTPFADSLREKIGQREGWSPEGVVVSGGSNILIQAIILASSIRGKILTVTPSFSLYELEASLLDNRVIAIPLKKDRFEFPRDIFLKNIQKGKPRIVFLANPNAPTGNLFSEEDLLDVLKVADKVGSLVVIDEAYYPFSGQTMRPHLKEFKNLILIRTLSKAFSLGGVRLGYLLAYPEIAAEILKVTLPFSVGILSQVTGECVLEESGYVEKVVREIVAEREKVYKALQGLPGLTVYPSNANYLLFQSDRSEAIFQGLLKEGILIRNVSTKRLPNALRVTIGSLDENQFFLDTMRKISTGTDLAK